MSTLVSANDPVVVAIKSEVKYKFSIPAHSVFCIYITSLKVSHYLNMFVIQSVLTMYVARGAVGKEEQHDNVHVQGTGTFLVIIF
jgi:hypothetical protein